MAKAVRPTTLTTSEKAIIKALLNAGERNQDIQALVNIGRVATINSGRITGIKKNASIVAATPDEVALYRLKKAKFDTRTGLCTYDDERLVRAREAMILAVEIFNTPRIAFKAGVFAMLCNVAWTYLLHEHYVRKGVEIIGSDGRSLLLSQMVARSDCPVPSVVKKNILAVKEIRDVVEHLTIGPFDARWAPIFQANCLNFEKYIVELFGDRLSLQSDLGFVIQFSKLSMATATLLQNYAVSPHIAALDASLKSAVTDAEADDIQYQFKVVYSLQSATKGTAHFQFVQPGSEENAEIANVLLKYKISDELYPHKPSQVVFVVKSALKRKFTQDTHQRAWKYYKIRPVGSAKDKASTNRDYCIYHAAHKDYTYSDKWVSFLVEKLADKEEWTKVSKFKAGTEKP